MRLIEQIAALWVATTLAGVVWGVLSLLIGPIDRPQARQPTSPVRLPPAPPLTEAQRRAARGAGAMQAAGREDVPRSDWGPTIRVLNAADLGCVTIDYRDAEGRITTIREVQVQLVEGIGGHPTHFSGACGLRGGEWRTFRIDRVTKLVDDESGELFPLPQRWFIARISQQKRKP